MRACPPTEQIEAFLRAESSRVEWPELDEHLRNCTHCMKLLETLTNDTRIARTDARSEIEAAPGPLVRRALEASEAPDDSRGTDRSGIVPREPAESQKTEPMLPPRSTAEARSGLSGESNDEDVEDALGILEPTERPGSLGRVGHYEIMKVLGRGAFGVVFQAFDEVLQRDVALKMMAARLAATSPARKRFLREARAAGQVRHENVVRIHAVAEQPIPYLVMELLPGETLQRRLDRLGPLDAAEVVAIARQVVEGLAAAHAVGLIHRDIKPGNLLIESEPRLHVRITDFGLARAVDDASLTQSGTVVGTPSYMSPEQARGETVDHRSDLFSLGSVLYAVTTGRPPFRAKGSLAILKRVTEDTPRPIREIVPETPDWLCRFIARLMAKDPTERFQSAAEVREALEAGPDSPHLRPPKRRSRITTSVAVTAACLALPAIALYWRPIAADRSARTIVASPVPSAKSSRIPANDREIALWVMARNGFLRPWRGRQDLRLPSELPAEPFTLELVDLGGTHVGDEDLVNLEAGDAVEILSLGGCPVTDAGLAHLRRMSNLRIMHLGGTLITGRGFSNLKGHRRVVEIWASGTEITDEGLVWFESMTSLNKLGIASTKVTDAGMSRLALHPTLSGLWVDDTALTDAGLMALKGLKSLKFVDVGRTAVTPKGLAAFHAARPDCRVKHDGGILE